jgi:uncharacterized protein (TIGR03790 family)
MITSLIVAIAACSPTLPPEAVVIDERAKSVLVVYNANAPEAQGIAANYAKARGVPASNVLSVKVTSNENVPKSAYKTGLVEPVSRAIAEIGNRIDFILMIRGLPIRIDHEYGCSVDASLMVDAHPVRKKTPLDWMTPPRREGGGVEIDPTSIERYVNPYGGSAEAFNSDKFAMYLCTRLDGYTVADAEALVTRSVSAQPLKGLFLLDSSPDRSTGGYGAVQRWLSPAQNLLQRKDMRVPASQIAPKKGPGDSSSGSSRDEPVSIRWRFAHY